MTLTLNGESRSFDAAPEPFLLRDLLGELGFADIPVLVEHNGVALRPREHSDLAVQDGDRLEIIRVVAGG